MEKYKVGDKVKWNRNIETGKAYDGGCFAHSEMAFDGERCVEEVDWYCGNARYSVSGSRRFYSDKMLEPADGFDSTPEPTDDTDTNVGNIVTRASILDEAKKCVCGDRDNQYGSPEDNFATIGRFWTEYLKGKCVSPGADVCVDAADVAAMMMLFKVARIKTGTGGKDSWVDAAGYAACGGEIANAPESE